MVLKPLNTDPYDWAGMKSEQRTFKGGQIISVTAAVEANGPFLFPLPSLSTFPCSPLSSLPTPTGLESSRDWEEPGWGEVYECF